MARALCAWPKLIEDLKKQDHSIWGKAERAVVVAEMLDAKGVSSAMDAKAVLAATEAFGEDDQADVCAQLTLIREYQEAEIRNSASRMRPLQKPSSGPSFLPERS